MGKIEENEEFPNRASLEIVNRIVKEAGFEEFKLKVAEGAAKGDNYVGIIFRVSVKGRRNGREESLELMVKAAPTNEDIRNTIPISDLFVREIYAYANILKKYDDIQKTVLLRDSEKINFIKCYGYSQTHLSEMLVMENLKCDQYAMFDRRISVDFIHASLALTNLARLHALSFVLQHREPDTFAEFRENIKEAFFTSQTTVDMTHFKVFYKSATEKAKSIIKDPLQKMKFEKFSVNAYERLLEAVKPGKYSVICHGDFWINNVLFKYEDGKPVDVRLLDYQIMRYSTPATDLLYFIFCCSGQELRLKHYEELLDIYHDALKNHLEAFSYDVNRIYPKNEFLNDVKKTSDFGLGMAIMTLVFFTCGEDNVPDVNDIMKGNTSMDDYAKGDSFKLYEERMLGVVADYVRYGYL